MYSVLRDCGGPSILQARATAWDISARWLRRPTRSSAKLNVLVALVVREHEHHDPALMWSLRDRSVVTSWRSLSGHCWHPRIEGASEPAFEAGAIGCQAHGDR